MRSPIAKFVAVGCISLGCLAATSSLYLCLCASAYVWWTLAPGVPAAEFFKRLKGAVVFIFVIVVVNAATENGRVLFEAGGLYITQEGIQKGLGQAVRLCIVLWGASLLVVTTPLEAILDACESRTTRKGHPVLAAGMISLTYLPMLVESARRVAIARRARGEDDRHTFFSGTSRVAGSALPLFSIALRSADELAEAMEARSYEPTAPRTRFQPYISSPLDITIAVCSAGLMCAALMNLV